MLTTTLLEQELGCEALYRPYPEEQLVAGFTSDLLSDVMGNCPEDAVLITIQAHTNTVAVATLAGVLAIVICSSRPVPDEMIAAAREEGIALFRTERNQFRMSCEAGARL
ncbi:hypothetical protein [Spirochaeta africana]|uniref:DRTGG domain-containing protein n=1 Tax=Spirochaeta africana (strain ATCC 700263 / DSM 8902 / Z-7692) TaxID=889378 RepID=H9ULN8_SPIAZ|nr:hypothetical protein [Spirochaeta africana]AFG38431.1 DRTGG domain-containing protein [Spirochaeta africana DSM 8902]